MSITLELESEFRKKVAETWWHSRLNQLLQGDHTGTACLRFIDENGDAVFNQFQIPVLLGELRALRTPLLDAELVSVLDDLVSRVESAEGKVGVYVRFSGD